ncbi:MAG: hypothetical protein L6Q99_14295 [Planctomycetes bacterium]|nr:hypothetical protein [Planctomycetota bacterium]
MNIPTTKPTTIARAAVATFASVMLAASCSSARTYGGPVRPATEVARAHFVQPLLLLEATARQGSICSVDDELVALRRNRLETALNPGAGIGSVELLPGEHTLRVQLRHGIPGEVRTVRWRCEPGASYSLRSRPSERQPPVELFVVDDGTGEELAKSWLEAPSIDAFGLDSAKWGEADWRVEESSHWITFTPRNVAVDGASERLRLEWSELDRWRPAPRAAWAVGVDLRRELERSHGAFEWQDLESTDTRSVHAWSGTRAGRAETLHGLVVVHLRDGRVTTGRWTSDDRAHFDAQLGRWSEFLGSSAWTEAWKESRP